MLLAALFASLVICGCSSQPDAPPPATADTLLFCFWNAENLFDDHDDHRPSKADRAYDAWFAQDPQALAFKLDHLSEALIKLNNGRGPDVLALAEVESVRAAELLQEALNRRLSDPSLRYSNLLMRELDAGRHIAPAILTRLAVRRDRTRLHGSHLRILEGHVQANGHDLVILATHWTSRVSDEGGTHREKYGDQIYGAFRGMHRSNPDVDLLVCGDFNDPPNADSVSRHLHATGDVDAVLHPSDGPLLLDLLADRDPEFGYGTHYYGRRWHTFDQIVISPGLLDDRGWSCDPASVHVINTLYRPGDRFCRPWRFGNQHDHGARGYSDHFPVTVRLSVH
jgi:endonuclease/exonuclease/phosphatase family metal-dependent hydrolase